MALFIQSQLPYTLILTGWREFGQVSQKCATYLEKHEQWDELCDLICQLHNQTPNAGIGGLRPVDLVLAHPPKPILAEQLHEQEGIPPTVSEFVAQTKARITEIDQFVRKVLLENHNRNTDHKIKTATLTVYHVGMPVALHYPTISHRARKTQCHKWYRS